MIIQVVFGITIMCDSYTYCKYYTIIDWDGVNWDVPSLPTLITTFNVTVIYVFFQNQQIFLPE